VFPGYRKFRKRVGDFSKPPYRLDSDVLAETTEKDASPKDKKL
jgi:hypothetical protein